MRKNVFKRFVTGFALTALLLGSGATLASAASAAGTVIKSSGLGSDNTGGSVAYTVGYNANTTGKVSAQIRYVYSDSKEYNITYASGRGTFTASVGYAAAPKYCRSKHTVVK